MALYGILLVTCAVSALALVLTAGQYSAYYSSAAGQLSLYSGLQNLEAFSQIVRYSSGNLSNQTFTDWLSAIEASGVADGITVISKNSTIVASPVSYPHLLYIHTVASGG